MSDQIEIGLHAKTTQIGKAIYLSIGASGPPLIVVGEKPEGGIFLHLEKDRIKGCGVSLSRLVDIFGSELNEVVEKRQLPEQYVAMANEALDFLAIVSVLSMVIEVAAKITVPEETPDHEAN